MPASTRSRTRLTPDADLLPQARGLRAVGHRVALLDSPPGSTAARRSHLCVLGEPRSGEPPDPSWEHVCLASFEHGLELHDVPSSHGGGPGAGLHAFPVRWRWTLDRHSGHVERSEDAPPIHELPTAQAGPPIQAGPVEPSLDREGFEAMVRQAKGYIRDGHSYQVNLSLRLRTQLDGDPTRLFDRLRVENPSPYQALVLTPELTVVSASPELLIDVEDRELATRPIAGTRPRGADRAEDERLEAELVRDAKERAEHAMLVDLARNDLGRVSRFGSVQVTDDAVVERYSHVMHLVSEVRGELADGRTPWDAFEAIFPCGTISGAPKHRSLEIIDELEPVPRGLYTGSLGLVTPERSTWNILIRTLVLQDGIADVQAGAGIVADSDPAREHAESLAKAQALLDALGVELEEEAP